jgi:hypothetical protein
MNRRFIFVNSACRSLRAANLGKRSRVDKQFVQLPFNGDNTAPTEAISTCQLMKRRFISFP